MVPPFTCCALFGPHVISDPLKEFGPFTVGIGTSHSINESVKVMVWEGVD
jgi:hypothetical protein